MVSNYIRLVAGAVLFWRGRGRRLPQCVRSDRPLDAVTKKRARAWGTVLMTSQVGAALSPLLVVPIKLRYGWRAPFFVFGLLGRMEPVAWYAWFRDSPRRKPASTRPKR